MMLGMQRKSGASRKFKKTFNKLMALAVTALLIFVIGKLSINGSSTAPNETAPGESKPSATAPSTPAPSKTAPSKAAPSQTAPGDNRATDPARSHNAAAVLETLEVKGRAPKTGYNRKESFGRAWLDTDRNGCRTRDDILKRDLSDITQQGRCGVEKGVLRDPYSGDMINFQRGPRTSEAVQIDHVVALSDAWQKGAQNLSKRERILLANDPLNLLAVSGPLNQQKSDRDAASWLPPNKSYRCPMVARQIAVKSRYKLWVTQAEKDAMKQVLKRCPDQTVPTEGFDPQDAPEMPSSWKQD